MRETVLPERESESGTVLPERESESGTVLPEEEVPVKRWQLLLQRPYRFRLPRHQPWQLPCRHQICQENEVIFDKVKKNDGR